MATTNINSSMTTGGVVLHNENSKCSRCYYQGKCGEIENMNMNGCEYFDSIEECEEDDDTYISEIIECGRKQYEEEFSEYMSDWE